MTSLSTDREKEFDFSSIFFLFFFSLGGYGVWSCMPFVLLCFFVLFLFVKKCLKKVQTKSELPSQDCVLLKIGVLKFLTTHSQRSRLCFLCSSTFFPPRLSESVSLLSYTVFCEHQWRDIANVLHLWMLRERLYGAVTHTDVNSRFNTNPYFVPVLRLSQSMMSPRGGRCTSFDLYILVMYRT